MNLIEQWHYEVDPFALKSEFCVICVLLIYILLYFILTKMLLYSMKNSENKNVWLKRFSKSCLVDFQMTFLNLRNAVF